MEVAIFVTNYNHRDYIKDCIKSLQNQSFKNFSVYIIDDSSTDDSIKLIKKSIKDDKRFQLIVNDNNIGKSKSLNKLLQIVKLNNYRYIGLLDSDDEWKANKLELQIKFLNNNPSLDVSYSEGELIYSSNYKKETWGSKSENFLFSDIHRSPKHRNEDLLDELLKGNFIFYSSLLLKTKVFNTIEFNNLIRRSMDWIFLLEVAKKYKFGYLEQPLANYRLHGDNLQAKVFKTHEVILPRIFVLNNYKNLMSRRTIAYHYYALSRNVLDIKVKQNKIDFFVYYLAGILHYPSIKKIFKLPLNLFKALLF
jgi:glycosyltransferase involved in cell wall biosynthesis